MHGIRETRPQYLWKRNPVSTLTFGSVNAANRGIVPRRDSDTILRSAYLAPVKALHQLRAKPGLI